MPELNTDSPEPLADQLPAVARLYYTGSSTRRYRRASTQDGPGEALCFKTLAIEVVGREAARARSEEMTRIIELAKREAALLAAEGMEPEANGVHALIQRIQAR